MSKIEDGTDVCPVCGFNKNISDNPKECLELGYLLGGRFVIGKALGIGSFSVSYIAWDCVDEIPVTVKEFLPSDIASHYAGSSDLRFFSEEDKKAFSAGLSTFRSLTLKLSKLSHLECVHNIIAYIDENETGYAVMEYLVGQTLKSFLAQYRTLSFGDVLDIMSPVIRTVAALHEQNIFHLSISPDNIFLCDDGRITLLNFASARFEMFSDIKRRSIFLHHGYAPIEMYTDDFSTSRSSDVYSLCAVIYKMVTGAVPSEPFARREGNNVLPPHELGFRIPYEAENAVMQGLSLYPEDRTKSADELLYSLDVSDDYTGDFEESSRKRKPVVSPKIIAIAAAGIALLIIGIVIAVFSINRDDPTEVPDTTTITEPQNTVDFSSDYKLTVCDASPEKLSPLKTKDGEIVYADTFVFEKNGLLGLIKTDGTVIKNASFKSISFDPDLDTYIFDGKVEESDSSSDGTKTDGIAPPVLFDKYEWDAENLATNRKSSDEPYTQFVSEASTIVTGASGKYGIVTRGSLLVDTVYDKALPISCGVCALKKDDKWVYLNVYGQDIFETTFEPNVFDDGTPFSFSDGCVPYYDKDTGLWGYADFNGEIFIAPEFLKALPVVNGKSFVRTTEGWQIISVTDDSSAISSLCGNNATFTLHTESGLLDITGSGELWDFTKTNTPWYTYRDSIRTVRITGQITYLGSYAFYGCDSLTSVTLPGSLISIGTSAFKSCTQLRTISLPSSLSLIGDEAFADCKALSAVICPQSLNYISTSAFKNCTNLSTVSIGDNLYSIADFAFYGCTSLTTLSITSKTVDIGNYSFAKCSSLEDVSMPTKAMFIGKGAFIDCSSITVITIPLGVTAINDEAFKNCSSLTNITLGDGLQLVGKEAFSGCTSLRHITLPQTVLTVGERAFSGCSSLASASVPSAVTIGAYAFSGCTSITTFEIAETVKNLGAYAFNGWRANQTIYGKNMLLKLTIAKPSGWDSSWNAGCKANISAR